MRSIENFSTGRRGALSAEYFLKCGFPVVFFHREGSIEPFLVDFQTKLNHLLVNYNPKHKGNSDFNNKVEAFQKYSSS